MNVADSLTDLIADELQQSVSDGARALADVVRARHGAAVKAVLFYGSCLRKGDDRDGVLDLYVLVDRYRDFYTGRLPALANAIMPPNVFYLEASLPGGSVRAKYAVVSFAQFERDNSARCFHSYFWARFAQPCALVYAADAVATDRVVRAVSAAVVTFVRNGVPLMPPRFKVAALWIAELRQTYRGELRSERGDMPGQLVDAAPERYARVTRAALPHLPFPTAFDEVTGEISVETTDWARNWGRRSWPLRRATGKAFSVLRLLKGAVTFEGGVDYVLWKIERHSGVAIDPAWRAKRFPYVALAVMFWRLYRKRAVR